MVGRREESARRITVSWIASFSVADCVRHSEVDHSFFFLDWKLSLLLCCTRKWTVCGQLFSCTPYHILMISCAFLCYVIAIACRLSSRGFDVQGQEVLHHAPHVELRTLMVSGSTEGSLDKSALTGHLSQNPSSWGRLPSHEETKQISIHATNFTNFTHPEQASRCSCEHWTSSTYQKLCVQLDFGISLPKILEMANSFSELAWALFKTPAGWWS